MRTPHHCDHPARGTIKGMGRCRGFLIGSLLLLSACGSSSHGTPPEVDAGADAARDCVDGDGDGFGAGGDCSGADCDDADADRHEGCGADCAADPRAPGCPCEGDAPAEPCYGGPEGTAGVGACLAGAQTCRRNTWSVCEGEVVPLADETCNAADDDCDGEVDEGTLSACGDCNATCRSFCAGVECPTPFLAGLGTRVENDGALVSAPVMEPPDDLWLVASSDVLRVDGPSRAVVGRYEVGERFALAGAIVLDGRGSAYIASGAEESFAVVGVVKVLAGDCPDQDGDGRVETTTTEVALPFGQDECLVWRAEIDDCDPRCEEVGPQVLTDDGEHLWVWTEWDGLLEFDTGTGERTGRSYALGYPAAMVDDGRGHLWIRQYPTTLLRVPSADPDPLGPDVEVLSLDPTQLPWDGFALDVAADGTIFAGSPLVRIEAGDPVVGTASAVEAWSLAIDGEGDVWSANDYLGELHQSTAALDDDELVAIDDLHPGGVAADRSGDIWVASKYPGSLWLLDHTTGEVLSNEIAGCADCLGDHTYLFGDPTGLTFERAYGPRWARGEGTAIFASDCPTGEAWTSLTVELSAGRARVSVRAADRAEELGAAPWAEIGNFPQDGPFLFDGAGAVGAVHEVRLQTLDHPTRVARVTVLGGCVE